MRHRLEYALAWLIVKSLGALPRPLARAAGISLGWIIYLLHHRLRSVGIRNLALAYPERAPANALASCGVCLLLSGGNWRRFVFSQNTVAKILPRLWCMTDSRISSARSRAARECYSSLDIWGDGNFPRSHIRYMGIRCTW